MKVIKYIRKVIDWTNNFIQNDRIISSTFFISMDIILVLIAFEIFFELNPLIKLISDISVAVVAGVIFYIFQVYVPEKKKIHHHVEHFKTAVLTFKSNIISALIRLPGLEVDVLQRVEFNWGLVDDDSKMKKFITDKKVDIITQLTLPINEPILESIKEDCVFLEKSIDNLLQAMTFSEKYPIANLRSISTLTYQYINLRHPIPSGDAALDKKKLVDFEIRLIDLIGHIFYLLSWYNRFTWEFELENPLKDFKYKATISSSPWR